MREEIERAATAPSIAVAGPKQRDWARPDLLLINDDDLTYAKVRLDEHSMRTAVAHLADFEDSLARSLIWAAAWDMTRDGQWPASRYIDLVTANIAAETSSTVMLVLLRQLATAVTTYVDPAHRRCPVAAGLESVDWVLYFDDDTPERLLRNIKPDVLVKGGDYRPDQIVGAEIVKGYGGSVKILGYVESCSTTAIVNKILQQ